MGVRVTLVLLFIYMFTNVNDKNNHKLGTKDVFSAQASKKTNRVTLLHSFGGFFDNEYGGVSLKIYNPLSPHYLDYSFFCVDEIVFPWFNLFYTVDQNHELIY